jgi:hypothetical protein
MSAHLTAMRLSRVSLVDKGAAGHRFAILKRDGGPVRKLDGKAATFGQLQAGREGAQWLEAAMTTLATLIDLAMYPADPATTVQERLTGLVEGVDQFKAELVMHVGAALQGQPAPAVAKRTTSRLAGIL